VTTEFLGPEGRKVVLLTFWSQFGTKLVDWQFKKFRQCSCREGKNKCNHVAIYVEINYITYTYEEWIFEKDKSHSRPNVLHLKITH